MGNNVELWFSKSNRRLYNVSFPSRLAQCRVIHSEFLMGDANLCRTHDKIFKFKFVFPKDSTIEANHRLPSAALAEQ
jgi:hypothetical protein